MDTERIGMAAAAAGAGRMKLGDDIDHSAGIMLFRKTGDYVNRGEAIAEIRASDPEKAVLAAREFSLSLSFSDKEPEKQKLIFARVDRDGVEYF